MPSTRLSLSPFLIAALPLAALAAPPARRTAAPAPRPRTILSRTVDFARDIQPILKAHCFQCHSGMQQQGGLVLDLREAAVKGGASGAAIVPGDSAKSPLLERVLGHGGKPRMPLGFAPLPLAQVALLRAWIDAG